MLSEPALAAWGVPAASPLHADALVYLRIKAAGAPFLVTLLVAQACTLLPPASAFLTAAAYAVPTLPSQGFTWLYALSLKHLHLAPETAKDT